MKVNRDKLSNFFKKVKSARNKIAYISSFYFLSSLILKDILGTQTKSSLFKINALNYPVNRLIVAPSIGIGILFVLLLIILNLNQFGIPDVIAYLIVFFGMWGISLLLLPFNYFLFPINLSVRDFFKKNGSYNTVIEYQFLTKVLYISIPVMVATSFLTFFITNQNFVPLSDEVLVMPRFFSIILVVASTMISISGILKLLLLISQKDFRFYLAKSSLGLSLELNNEYEKLQYSVFGLHSYNLYLKRLFKLQIRDLSQIFEKIISNSPDEMNNIIKEIHSNMEIENLKIMRSFSNICSRSTNEKEFLIKISFKDKIREWSPVVAIVSTVSISLIQSIPSIWDSIKPIFEGENIIQVPITNSTLLLYQIFSFFNQM